MAETPNKWHFVASHVVLCREVVLFLEVQNVLVLWEWYFEECPLQRGRPFLGVSFIGGSTVVGLSWVAELYHYRWNLRQRTLREMEVLSVKDSLQNTCILNLWEEDNLRTTWLPLYSEAPTIVDIHFHFQLLGPHPFVFLQVADHSSIASSMSYRGRSMPSQSFGSDVSTEF